MAFPFNRKRYIAIPRFKKGAALGAARKGGLEEDPSASVTKKIAGSLSI